MGVKSRREREREQRRAAIMAAATAVFAEEGIEHAAMSAIAARAELGKASLYYYFPNKDALVHAVLVEGTTAFFAELSEAVPEGRGLADTFEALLICYLHFFRDKPLLGRILGPMMVHGRGDGPLDHALMSAHAEWLARLDALLEHSPWAGDKPAFLAFLTDVVSSLVRLHMAGRSDEADARVAFYVDLVRGRLERP